MTKVVDNRFFAGKRKLVPGLLVCGLIGGGMAFQIPGAGATNDDRTFKLREVSVFDGNKQPFIRGQICICQDKPFPEVKHYPDFASKAPLFGAVRFGAKASQTNAGALFYFAVDESRGTGKGYDRLYFDGNRDLDLRNDPVAKLQPNPPDQGFTPFMGTKAAAVFDFLKVNLGANDSSPILVEIMPRLLVMGSGQQTYGYMFFVRTRLFEGDIQIAGTTFRAMLGNDHAIYPGFDSPGTALVLSQGGNSSAWWGGDRLSAVHKVDGRFFSFSATLAGELTVHPYQGDLGTFEIGPGDRKLTNANFSVSGSLQSKDWAVAVGGDIERGQPVEASRCQLPVGDYLPEYLTVQFGRLRIAISQNYHSEGKRQNRGGRPDVFGIAIRKDHPFALDFSNKPEVMFTSPAPGEPVKPGDTLMVAAVLVDPKLDIMIRGLDDTSPKQTTDGESLLTGLLGLFRKEDTSKQATDADGKPLSYQRPVSLDPKVIITRANGEKVAEGVMPFG
jgi:hypothetical protein